MANIKKILLIEDSKSVHVTVDAILRDHFQLICASNLAEAREILDQRIFSLILLDVRLPDGNGFEFCTELKGSERFKNIPLIFLTGESDFEARIKGLDLGADDYIVKPFHGLEFLARVKSKLRQKSDGNLDQFKKMNFRVDLNAQKIFLTIEDKEQLVSLTPIEFKLLVFFLKNEDKVLSREEILKSIWGTSVHVSNHTLDTHISSIRKKIMPYDFYLKSVIKKGYSFSFTANMPKSK